MVGYGPVYGLSEGGQTGSLAEEELTGSLVRETGGLEGQTGSLVRDTGSLTVVTGNLAEETGSLAEEMEQEPDL